MALTRQLNAAPREVVIIGVRPYRVECGLDLTAEANQLVPRIVDLVLAELR